MDNDQQIHVPRALQSAIQFLQAGRLQKAEELGRQVLAVEEDNEDANHLLGIIAFQSGNFAAAVKYLARAAEINPEQAAYFNNLGNAYNEQGHTDKATACYRKALAIRPDYANAYNNLGKLHKMQRQLKQAATCYRKALAINPRLAETHNNLGNVYNELGYAAEATACYRNALAIRPDYARAYNNLGRLLKDQGNLQEAVGCFRKALSLEPQFAGAHSNLLFTLNYLPHYSQSEIYQESVQWDTQHVKGLPTENLDFYNSPKPGRRLRIGYVSPDFRVHSVAYFFEPVLKTHKRDNVEVYCYSNVVKSDDTTVHLKAAADNWISIVGMNDADIFDQIKKDRIDILVDLTGHTGDNSLLVFAHKPAPVQVSWLGYPNTTGLHAIDYRLTDEVADPVGVAGDLHSEYLVRLEHGFLCFQADESSPEVSGLPCLEKDHITFGSFNDLAKTTPEVVQLWSALLRSVPGSRLLMKAKQLADDGTRGRYLELFEKEGIARQRIELYGRLAKREDHLGFYSRVDIGLDPFPYNGTTTTCEALWMGVPVVTLRGSRHAGRVGASIMHRVGLLELIAENAEAYVTIAQTLASDRRQLAAMRQTLRARMSSSPLMDTQGFVAGLEHAYRQMWVKWCGKRD